MVILAGCAVAEADESVCVAVVGQEAPVSIALFQDCVQVIVVGYVAATALQMADALAFVVVIVLAENCGLAARWSALGLDQLIAAVVAELGGLGTDLDVVHLLYGVAVGIIGVINVCALQVVSDPGDPVAVVVAVDAIYQYGCCIVALLFAQTVAYLIEGVVGGLAAAIELADGEGLQTIGGIIAVGCSLQLCVLGLLLFGAIAVGVVAIGILGDDAGSAGIAGNYGTDPVGVVVGVAGLYAVGIGNRLFQVVRVVLKLGGAVCCNAGLHLVALGVGIGGLPCRADDSGAVTVLVIAVGDGDTALGGAD